MNECVQRVASTITSKEDWLPLLEKELGQYDNDQGTDLLQRLFKVVLEKEIPIDALRKLVRFDLDRGQEIDQYAEWTELVAAYGNKDALIVMNENFAYSASMSVLILDAAASRGRERLIFVLDFLKGVTIPEVMFGYYVKETNYLSTVLSEKAKLVLTVVSDYLGIDAYKYDWVPKTQL